MRPDADLLDCLIIGGGAAGLCAATYLGRFRRNVAVVDSGRSRLKRIPMARNVPGFPGGIEGAVLHARLRAQAEHYGARLLEDEIGAIAAVDGHFEAVGTTSYRASAVLLATGVTLNEPPLEDVDQAVARGLLRYCPICDGPETEGLRVAVLARHRDGVKEARFLRRFSDRVAYIAETREALLLDDARARAEKDGLEVLSSPLAALSISADKVLVTLASGGAETFDCLYPCLGCAPRSDLAVRLGCAASSSGGALTDAHQRLSVRGAYAAGDVLEGVDQIASAWGQAAIAATAIHNDLSAAAR